MSQDQTTVVANGRHLPHWLDYRVLLVFVPLAIAGQSLAWNPEVVFITAFLGLIPLAATLGEATEVLAIYLGKRVGALLNATFGNAPELIILFALLRSGQVTTVKATIIGSMLLTLLLSPGLSQLLGGLKHGNQRFDRESATAAATTMLLAVAGLLTPTLLGTSLLADQTFQITGRTTAETSRVTIDDFSLGVAVVLFLFYLVFLAYQFTTPDTSVQAELEETTPRWTRNRSLAILLAATLGIAVVSEILSDSVEPFGESLGLTPLFMGLMVLPVAGNVSEILVGVRLARRNQLGLSLSTLSAAVMQVALFVTPLMVFISALIGQPFTLAFSLIEIIALALAVGIAIQIAADGRSNWLEGVQLLVLYLLLGLWFFFISPAPA